MSRRQRKGKSTSSEDVPMVKPSEIFEKKKTKKPLIEISEEEQRRLIKESGVLKQIPRPGQALSADAGDLEDMMFCEEVGNVLFHVVPLSFLMIMMDILIHYQYNRKPTLRNISDRLVSGVPIMAIFIFYTSRYKSYRITQILLFAVSIASGSRLIYQINHSNWLTNMKQCPPLATIWIYTIFVIDLGPALFALLTVGSFVWWKDLKIIL